MEVKDLIVELLEFDPAAKVELYVDSEEESDDLEFKLDAFQRVGRNYLSIEVDLDSYVMVDKPDYENMKMELENLEEELAGANRELEELRNE